MTLQVYLDPCTVNSRKVLAGLDMLDAPFELTNVDYFAGAHKQPDYLAINPNGAVPAAVDGELMLSESNAILQYAADLNNRDSFYPKDLKVRADINRWLLWEAATWFPSCYIYLVEYVVKPLLNAEADQSIIDTEAPNWHKLAAILDTRLAKHKWLAGDHVTIADIAVAAPMHVHNAAKLPIAEHKHLSRWLTEDVETLPCWQKTQASVDRALGITKVNTSAGIDSVEDAMRTA